MPWSEHGNRGMDDSVISESEFFHVLFPSNIGTAEGWRKDG